MVRRLAKDWALHMLARRDISQAAMDEIVEAQTAILYGLIDAVRELANQLDAKGELPAATKRNSAWPHASCGTLRVRGDRRG